MVKDAKDLGKYEDFLHQMRRAFTTTDQEEDAHQEFLGMLKKYDKVLAVDTAKFIGEFRGLADLVNSTDSELILAIRDRLHKEIKNVLAARGSSQWPKKWSEYCDYVLNICKDMGIHQSVSSMGPASKDPNAMEVDNTSKQKQSGSKPTQQQRSTSDPRKRQEGNALSMQEAQKKGVCYICGKPRHWGKLCPSKKTGDSAARPAAANTTSSTGGSKGKSPDFSKPHDNDSDVEIQVVRKSKGTGNPPKPVKAIEAAAVTPEATPGPSKKKHRKVKITKIVEPSRSPSPSGHISEIDSDEDNEQGFGRCLL
ncbi:uncharacterized protein FIBRA_09469 [Fibroporia radiculosa]|uniref:CCHC-type domain-containing protein n=1 Tax=Fibroporia radiculosa TaxID=599839 RepID=J7SD21_9APHY|nr:uncharacterized protein FIBRA_09469 [Fibroporia radiculosa]CCM07133.1 predicted protein [Fibroporia radiculosa]